MPSYCHLSPARCEAHSRNCSIDFSGSQLNHVDVMVSLKCCVEASLAVALVVPDPTVERQLEPLGATLSLDRLAMVACRSSDRRCDAGKPGASDDDHRVGASES